MSGIEALKVAIVEDEGLFREAVRRALEQVEGLEIVGDFGEAAEALAAIPALAPDVLVLDIDLGRGMSGIELGKALGQSLPQLGVVLLSNHSEPSYLAALPGEGLAWSYLIKKSVADLGTLARAIRGTAQGFVVLDPSIARALGAQFGRELVPREAQVLELLAEGYSNKAIADRMCLAEKTIENMLTTIYRRLGIDSKDQCLHPRVRAAMLCLKQRLPGISPLA